jgi:bifunctional non-homologous end joining protein LigD
MLPRIQPIAPPRIARPFDHNDWCFEIKMDCWRCKAYLENGKCELVSRNQNVYKSFARLTKELAKLPVKSAIIDAEIVCLDAQGRSVFLDLMRKRKADAILYAFDLVHLDGQDLRQLPLVERRRSLRRLIRGHERLLFAQPIQGSGVELFQAVCARDLEGIVAKHRLGPYEALPVTWFKILNPDYSQARGRKEMFEKFHEREHVAAP